MSECVVRMELPACCDDCPMEYDGFMCRAIHTRFYPKKDGCYLDPLIDTSKERLPDCPIICALPENHGRLVDIRDIDSMIEDVQATSDESGLYGLYYRDDIDFDGLPTIVPAERREE